MSWMKRQKKMKQKFLQLLPLVAADLQLLCPVPLRKGSRVSLTDESILSGLSWEERGERNLIPRNVLIDFSSLGIVHRFYVRFRVGNTFLLDVLNFQCKFIFKGC